MYYGLEGSWYTLSYQPTAYLRLSHAQEATRHRENVAASDVHIAKPARNIGSCVKRIGADLQLLVVSRGPPRPPHRDQPSLATPSQIPSRYQPSRLARDHPATGTRRDHGPANPGRPPQARPISRNKRASKSKRHRTKNAGEDQALPATDPQGHRLGSDGA